MKKLIVFEGLDGSGKATQCRKLQEHVQSLGQTVALWDYPRYDKESSLFVRNLLEEKYGPSEKFNPYGKSLFYALDRLISLKVDKEGDADVDWIFSNRYSTSNIVYQACLTPKSEELEFARWILDLEHNRLQLAKPDYVFYIDVEVDVARELLLKRYQGDSTKLDANEKNLAYQARCRETTLRLIPELGWILIQASVHGKLRSEEDIHNEIRGHLGV